MRAPAATPGPEAATLAGRLLGRLGRFEVRLAASPSEVELAQALRWQVFRGGDAAGRDADRFDAFCDHLLLLDPERGGTAASCIIGTYRLLREDAAAQAGGFYAQGEYDVAALVRRHPERRFLELGRSCVLPEARSLRTMELLWHGVWAYVLRERIDILFGCASLPGTEPDALRDQLAGLRDHALAPAGWQARAVAGRGTPLPAASTAAGNPAALPPLLKGYLRLGGRVSPEAVVDHDFGTTDVFLVLPREWIAPRYVAHYGAAAERFA